MGAYIILAVFFLIRLWLSFQFGLGTDEAHYALYGLNLDWSYFDHPPLVGWVEALFLNAFGVHDWVVRLPANLCGLFSGLLIYQITLTITKSKQKSIWALLASQVVLLPFALSLMFLPDSILLPLVLLLLIRVDKLTTNNNLQNWLYLGLVFGLCGLAKYTAVIYVVALVIYAFRVGKWKEWLTSRGLYFGVLISALCVLPVLYWNYQRHWISFTYQSQHVVGGSGFSWKSLGQSAAAQILLYNPLFVFAGLWFLIKDRSKNNLMKLIKLFFITGFAFFVYSSSKDFVLPHWTLINYLLLFIVLMVNLSNQHKKLLYSAFAFSFLILALLLSEFALHWMPFKDNESLYRDIYGWDQLHEDLVQIKKQKGSEYSLAVSNWTLGSRSRYYLQDLYDVFVLDERFDQFDIWESQQKMQKNLLFVEWSGFEVDNKIKQTCTQLQTLLKKDLKIHNYVVTSYQVLECNR